MEYLCEKMKEASVWTVIGDVGVEHVASSMSEMDAEAERKGVAGCDSGGLSRATAPSGVRHEHYSVLLMQFCSHNYFTVD